MFTKFSQMQLILLIKINSNNFTLCVFIIYSFYVIVSRTFNEVHRIHFLKLKCKKKSNVKCTYYYVDKRKKRKEFV